MIRKQIKPSTIATQKNEIFYNKEIKLTCRRILGYLNLVGPAKVKLHQIKSKQENKIHI